MAKVKGATSSDSPKTMRPHISPESRENQMISLAIDLAEKQLREGTASSQVITHFLKLGTVKAELEKEKIIHENKLLDAKTKALESSDNAEKRYQEAISAMKKYSGNGGASDDDY